MPFTDSSDDYTIQKGHSSKSAKSSRGVNMPSAKSSSPNATKQKSTSSLPKGTSKTAKSTTGNLNKNMKGENENSKMVNTKQKTQYPGRWNQPRGADSKASKQTTKSPKQRNLDSGKLF